MKFCIKVRRLRNEFAINIDFKNISKSEDFADQETKELLSIFNTDFKSSEKSGDFAKRVLKP